MASTRSVKARVVRMNLRGGNLPTHLAYLRREGVTPRRAPYSAGTVIVLDGPAPVAPAPATGQVQVRDRAGRLVATVPAGTIITIASGFRVALSFS